MKSKNRKVLATILSLGFVCSMGIGYNMLNAPKSNVNVVAETPENATIESGTLYDISELNFGAIDEEFLANGGWATLDATGGGMLINADGSNDLTTFWNPAGVKLAADFTTVRSIPETWPTVRENGFTFVMDGTNVCIFNNAIAILDRNDEVTCDIFRFDTITGVQYVEFNREFVKDASGAYVGVQCRFTIGDYSDVLYYETSNPHQKEFGILAVDCGSLTIASAKTIAVEPETTVESATLYDISELNFAEIDEEYLANGGSQTLTSAGGGMLINADGSNDLTTFWNPAGVKLAADFTTVRSIPETWPTVRENGFTFVMDGTNVCIFNNAIAILDRNDEVTCDIFRFDTITGVQYVEFNREFVKDASGAYVGVQCRFTIGDYSDVLYYETSNPHQKEFGILAVDCGSLTIASANTLTEEPEVPETTTIESGTLYDISELNFEGIDEEYLANGGSQTLDANGGGMLLNADGGWDMTTFWNAAGVKFVADFGTVGAIPAGWPTDRVNGFTFVMDGTNVCIYNNAIGIFDRNDESVYDIYTFDTVTGVQYVEINREFVKNSNGTYVGVQCRFTIGANSGVASYETENVHKSEFGIFAVDCGTLTISSANVLTAERGTLYDISELNFDGIDEELLANGGFATLDANGGGMLLNADGAWDMTTFWNPVGVKLAADFSTVGAMPENWPIDRVNGFTFVMDGTNVCIYNNAIGIFDRNNEATVYDIFTFDMVTGVQYVEINRAFMKDAKGAYVGVQCRVTVGTNSADLYYETENVHKSEFGIFAVDCGTLTIYSVSESALLARAKANAKAELDAYVAEADYEAADWATITAAIATAKTEIDACESIEQANEKVAIAQAVIDEVPTADEREAERAAALAEAKANAKVELDAYVAEADYEASDWATIAAAVATAKTEIDACTAVDQVSAKVAAVKAAIDNVPTAAEREAERAAAAAALAEAKTNAKAELDAYVVEADYQAADWATITAAIATAKTEIDACESIDEVNAKVAAVKVAIDEVPTAAERAAEVPANDVKSMFGCAGSVSAIGGIVMLLAGVAVVLKKKED